MKGKEKGRYSRPREDVQVQNGKVRKEIAINGISFPLKMGSWLMIKESVVIDSKIGKTDMLKKAK